MGRRNANSPTNAKPFSLGVIIKILKVKFTILFLALFSSTFGQTKSSVKRDKLNRIRFPNEFDIDSTNHQNYYNQAIKLASYHSYDSSQKAIDIFRSLVQFDEQKYSTNKFQAELKQIEIEVLGYYKLVLAGQWKFEWSGSNWGTSQTSKDLNRRIVFKNDKAIFYENDTIVRQTKFVLRNRFLEKGLLLNVFYYNIVFSDNEEWTFRLYKSFVPYIGKTNSIAILINKMPNCSCGCPEEVYEKILDKDLVKRQ